MRLDRHDSYLTTFQATVVEARRSERGLWLRLDRSAFYPTAGGQPHDTGTLEAAGHAYPVVDVEVEGDSVWHLLGAAPGAAAPGAGAPGAGAPGAGASSAAASSAADPGADPSAGPAVGAAVTGRIDWARRYRHMQRHTGQHLLSQALVRVSPDYGTRSVSMRGPDCTIDFGGEVDDAALAAVEREVNAAARRAHVVTTFEVEEERLPEYRLRRPAQVGGLVRLVAIGDYDLVACGGTHLKSSAEALPIKVLGVEKVKGGLNRLTFRAGEEALADYALKHEATTRLGVALSVPVAEVVERVERLREELAEQGRELAAARAAQAAALAERLAAGAEQGYLSAYLGEAEAALFDALVDALQRRPGTVSLLAAHDGEKARFAFLTGPGVELDVRPALRAALEPLGGRGGGRPDRAQGAAAADREAAEAALARALALLRAGA